jgi:hypothetical protein
MNKRRRFLLAGAAAVLLAGLGVAGIGPLVGSSEIIAHVRRRLNFLKLDEAGLHAFAKDHVAALLAKRPTWNRMKYHFMSIFSKSFTRYERSTDKRSRSERIVDNLASTYLLSSDFFVNGADASRTVRYVGLYDPMHACGNPFARPPIQVGEGT